MRRGPGTLSLNVTFIFKDRLSLMQPRLDLNSPSHCLANDGLEVQIFLPPFPSVSQSAGIPAVNHCHCPPWLVSY